MSRSRRGSTVGALHQESNPYRDVAQFGSAPRLGRGGRTFESCHPDHLKKEAYTGFFFVAKLKTSAI